MLSGTIGSKTFCNGSSIFFKIGDAVTIARFNPTVARSITAEVIAVTPLNTPLLLTSFIV